MTKLVSFGRQSQEVLKALAACSIVVSALGLSSCACEEVGEKTPVKLDEQMNFRKFTTANLKKIEDLGKALVLA